MTVVHVLWEKAAIDDPVAHDATRKKRWMIAGGVAALLSLTVISFGVWGLVYPAIVLVIAAMAIEPKYWMRKRIPTQRIWTDGTFLGVDGASEVIAHPRDPVPLSSVTALTVYPIAGGDTSGASINGVSTSTRVHYTAIDLWLTDGTRRMWILNRISGIEVRHEVALAQALRAYLPDRWRGTPGDDDMGADVGDIDRRRLAAWPPDA